MGGNDFLNHCDTLIYMLRKTMSFSAQVPLLELSRGLVFSWMKQLLHLADVGMACFGEGHA